MIDIIHSPYLSARDKAHRGALLILYAMPFIAGVTGEHWAAIPAFAAVFAIGTVTAASRTLSYLRRYALAYAISLIVVAGVFAFGMLSKALMPVPLLVVPLPLLLGVAAAAGLILRPTGLERQSAQFHPTETTVSFYIDLCADTLAARGNPAEALDSFARSLAALGDEDGVLKSLRARQTPEDAALITLLAQRANSGHTSPDETRWLTLIHQALAPSKA